MAKEILQNPAKRVAKTIFRKGGTAGAILVGLVLCPGDDIAVSVAVAASTLRQETPEAAVLPRNNTLFDISKPTRLNGNGDRPSRRHRNHLPPLKKVIGPTKIVSIGQ